MDYEPSGLFITLVLELKLDMNTMFEWQKYSQAKTEVPHYQELLEFINQRMFLSNTYTLQAGQRLEVDFLLVHTEFYYYTGTCNRYSIVDNLEQDLFIIGKKNSTPKLSDEELSLLASVFPYIDLSHHYVEYHRLLKEGVIFTSTSYNRQTSTRDYIIFFIDGVVGFAQKYMYISVCRKDCTLCRLPCTHAVIAEVFEKLDCDIITDSIRGASARQIQCIDESRWIVLLCDVRIALSL